MKKNEANIFVFIASIIIGILISSNFSLSKGSTWVFLSAKQYKDAYDKKNQLIGDISNLKDKYNEYMSKINNYKYGEKTQDEVLSGFKKEIQDNSLVLGSSDVHGPGIKITLNDSSGNFSEDVIDEELSIIHNTDMIQVINDLKNAGAEAISINGQRVTDRTEVYCNGAFLRVNGVKIAAPFYILAIGDKDVLKNYMLSEENYLKGLMLRGIEVDVEQDDEIKINSYSWGIKDKFMKNVKQ